MSKVLSVRLPDELAEWVERYAGTRDWSRQDLLEQAVMAYKEDCDSGVPVLRERIARVRANAAPQVKPSREDYARSLSERSKLFRGDGAAVAASRFGVEAKMKARREAGDDAA